MAEKKAQKAMTKAQLMTYMAEKSELPKKKIVDVFNILVDIAYKEAKKDAGFVLPGLGKLVVVKTKARMGRNPQTKEPIKIEAKKRLKFRIAKQAKDAITPSKK